MTIDLRGLKKRFVVPSAFDGLGGRGTVVRCSCTSNHPQQPAQVGPVGQGRARGRQESMLKLFSPVGTSRLEYAGETN